MNKTVILITVTCLIIILFSPVTKGYTSNENKSYINVLEYNLIETQDYDKCYTSKKVDKIKKRKNLMIVAHPDDESLWGGAHLLEDDYTVVCVTCGVVNYRVLEFKKAMNLTNDSYIMLGYPDLKGHKIDRWETSYNLIYNSLSEIISSDDWDLIVTHNKEGEYGHIQHIMINRIVTSIVVDKKRLYYFGKYNILENSKYVMNEDVYNKKINQLLPIYVSQPKAIKRHANMAKHEEWLNYFEY